MSNGTKFSAEVEDNDTVNQIVDQMACVRPPEMENTSPNFVGDFAQQKVHWILMHIIDRERLGFTGSMQYYFCNGFLQRNSETCEKIVNLQSDKRMQGVPLTAMEPVRSFDIEHIYYRISLTYGNKAYERESHAQIILTVVHFGLQLTNRSKVRKTRTLRL